jgi:hypothetical protein
MLKIGVIPDDMLLEEESVPEYKMSPVLVLANPTAKCVTVADPAVHSPNKTEAVLLTRLPETVNPAPVRAIATRA